MKQNFRMTLKLMAHAAALLLLLVMLRHHYEGVPAVSEVYGEVCREEEACRPEDFDTGREIRVLLTNPDGGYYFDSIELCLKGRTYHFTEQDVRRSGTVRIRAGEERIEFFRKKGENAPALYQGDFLLRCGEQGIYVVNSLPLEAYLKLVVPGEMPAGYPEEALKSQAVLARTYAAGCMLQPALPEYCADLDDTTGFQVYGSCGENDSATKAVEATEGCVLCADGAVAKVHYFSTSCGQTTTTEAWCLGEAETGSADEIAQISPAAAGNLQAEPGETPVHVGSGEPAYTPEELCQEDVFASYISGFAAGDFERDIPWYRWEYQAELDPERLLGRIRERYREQPSQVLSRRAGKEEFDGEYPADPGKIRDIRVTRRSPGGCACELLIAGTKGDILIRNEYSIRYVLCDTVSEAVLQDGSARKTETLLPSAFFIIKTGKDRQDVIGYSLVGGGFGHGIGMSQNGAAAMAEAGWDHQQIIAFFYPAYQMMQLQRIG